MALRFHLASLSFGASVDQQTGHLSIFDVIEEIRVPQVPVHLQSLVISLALEKTQAGVVNGKMLIHIFTPDGSQQVLGQGDLQIPAEQKRVKAVFRFGGFPILMFGIHRIVLSWIPTGGQKQGEAILDFEVTQVAQVAQGIPPAEKPPISH